MSPVRVGTGAAGVDRVTLAYVPTVRDRVAQQAAKLVLESVFEADYFLPCSYGFRPKRSAAQAMELLRTGFIAGYCFVVEFDIRNFFGEISHERLLPR
jgi:RNA-directed DNA polymerase